MRIVELGVWGVEVENEICGRSRGKKFMVLLNFVGYLEDLRGWGIYVWRVEIKIGWELSEWRKQFVHVTV